MIENAAFKSLDPVFQPIVREICTKLEKLGWTPVVAEGRRTVEQQRQKVQHGYSKTMKSYHLSGLAADIIQKGVGWDGEGSSLIYKFWYQYALVLKEMEDQGKWFIRRGIDWNVPGRWEIYQKAYDTKKPGLITWFADVAHCELRTK